MLGVPFWHSVRKYIVLFPLVGYDWEGAAGKLGLHRLDGNCGAPRIHGVTINAAFLIEYAHQPHRGATVMGADTLTITDDRTGDKYTLQIENGAIRASDLRSIKLSDDDFGLMSYDPAFSNTASTKSAITFIDGDKGILRYRGYPIEQLAEQSTFMETSYLIINGELPTNDQLGGLDVQHYPSFSVARERQEVHGGVSVRRASDGDAVEHGRGAIVLLSGREGRL